MLGSKYRNLVLTIILINVPNLLNFIFAIDTQAVSEIFRLKFQNYEGRNPILLLISLTLWIASNWFLYQTALADPGFIPRQIDD